jgi:hypothetical protein
LLLFKLLIKKKALRPKANRKTEVAVASSSKKKSRDFTPALNIPLRIWWRNIAPFLGPSRAFSAGDDSLDGDSDQTVY